MYRGYVENVWGDEDTYLDHMGNTGIIWKEVWGILWKRHGEYYGNYMGILWNMYGGMWNNIGMILG